MKYFEYLPKIDYQQQTVTNIMLRAKIREFVLSNASVYYLHTVQDGERPDVLATTYYGNAKLTWLIFYANNIFDPLFDWALDSRSLHKHIENKYGAIDVAHQTPHHYLLDETFVIDKFTYEDKNIEAGRKRVVSLYQYEVELNDKKREIKLIDDEYSRQITNEILRLFS